MVSSFTIYFLCREFSYSDGKINNKKQEKDRLDKKKYKKIIMPLNKSEDAGPTSDFLQGGVGAELP